MAGRGGTRRGSGGLSAADALAIVLVIILLGSSLGALIASRDPQFVGRTQMWARAVVSHLSPSLLLPNRASAEAPPSPRLSRTEAP